MLQIDEKRETDAFRYGEFDKMQHCGLATDKLPHSAIICKNNIANSSALLFKADNNVVECYCSSQPGMRNERRHAVSIMLNNKILNKRRATILFSKPTERCNSI
jgi:hypothetical protein